jgi:branched-chain amino acid transport system substrate-binding protein
MRRRFRWLGAVVGVAALVASACGGSQPAAPSGNASPGGGAAAPKEIVLGSVLPLSGAFESSGKYFQQGYQMAVDEVNAAGGLDVGGQKYPVRLIVQDDGSNPTQSRSLVEKLVTEQHVTALLGGYDTVLVEAQEGVPDQYKIPYVEGGGAASAIFTRGYHYVFGTLDTVYDMGKMTMDFLKHEIDLGHLPKPTTIALVWENTDHGKDYQAAVEDAAKADPADFKVVLDQPFQLNGADFSPLLTQVKASNAAVFLSDAHLPDFITMHRQYTQMGLHHLLVSYGARGPDQKGRQALGPAADYLVAALWWTPALQQAKSQAFTQAYQAKYHQTPDWFQALAYDTARVMLAAIHQAGSLDGTKIRDALAGLDFKDSVLPGGELRFDPTGKPITNYVMVQNMPQNQVQIIWPLSLSGAKEAVVPMPGSK